MRSPLISIIVPVYNASNYLEKCLISISSQRFSDFEVVLVDDGSTDNSPEICRSHGINDTRFRFFSKLNGGVSSARNSGIREARGRFITFIDSDDYIKEDYLEKLVNNIDESVDLIQSGLIFFDNNSGQIMGREVLPEHDMLSRSMPAECYSITTLPLITSPVSKLYRASIIKDNNIYFDESLSYGEDRDFNLRYIQNIKAAKSISYCGYFYRKELSNSLSCNRDYLKMLDIDLQYWNNLKNYLESNKCISETVITYLADRLFNIYNDRLLQYAKSDISYNQLRSVINKVITDWSFKWLRSHMKYVSANAVVKCLYRSGNVWILTTYLHMV